MEKRKPNAYDKLVAPVTYQGGKQRIAGKICDAITSHDSGKRISSFIDICCGSGAVSIEMMRRGIPPHAITMVDAGPWGMFWKQVGDGSIDIESIENELALVPENASKIKSHAESISREPVPEDYIPRFLVLQACAIGGKAVWIQDGCRWVKGAGFRDYWTPTRSSSRRYPVNPMMPMPKTILERVKAIASMCRGVRGMQQDASCLSADESSVAYIDPPYKGTTGYPYTLDAQSLATRIGCPTWVSECRAASETAVIISTGSKKGGITGERSIPPHEEWLSFFDGRSDKLRDDM